MAIIKKIVVLYGGLSEEREVSENSAKEISKSLLTLGYDVISIDLSQDCSYEIGEIEKSERGLNKQKVEIGSGIIDVCRKVDIVFLATHGGIGENGKLQAIFDVEKIDYTGNSFFSTAISMDKKLSKIVASSVGIKCASNLMVDRIQANDFPIVIKPIRSGSSKGIKIFQNKKQFDIYYKEHPELGSFFVEKYIKGREFSVGILGETVLPVIEIKVKNGFYDYNNKYTVGAAEEVVPAKISEKLTHTLQKSAYKIHKALGFNVYSRTDFIVDEKGDVYFIESNSLPGMTKTSLLPQEAKAAGIDFPNLCERIIELSREIRSQ